MKETSIEKEGFYSGILSILLRTNIFVAVCAVALTYETTILIGGSLGFNLYLLIVFFATILEYNARNIQVALTNISEISSRKEKIIHLLKSPNTIIWILAALGFTVSLAFSGLMIVKFILPCALLTFFYSFSLYKRGEYSFAIRNVPYLKVFFIALIWAVVTVLIPVMIEKPTLPLKEISILMASRFLFIFSICLPFDIRDRVYDERAGLKTIPMKLGITRTMLLAKTIMVVFILLSLSIPPMFIAVKIGLCFSGIITLYILSSKELQKSPNYHHAILDGSMLIQGLLVLAAYLTQALWIFYASKA